MELFFIFSQEFVCNYILLLFVFQSLDATSVFFLSTLHLFWIFPRLPYLFLLLSKSPLKCFCSLHTELMFWRNVTHFLKVRMFLKILNFFDKIVIFRMKLINLLCDWLKIRSWRCWLVEGYIIKNLIGLF